MTHYVYSNTSYYDYLQNKDYAQGIEHEISKQSRAIIATNKELAAKQINVMEKSAGVMSQGFEQISMDLKSISSQMSEMNHLFNWGFSEILSSLGNLKDSLQELIRIASTPSQTWAYEQFEIARDAFRKHLYIEAIDYLNRAIDGFQGQTGYRLEYRFHFLLGIIRLGSFTNNDSSIVSLEEAEKGFLSAARYSEQDKPREAARAYLAAGWACYCQGKFDEAEKYTQQAISKNERLAEAHFQLAKIQMHCDQPRRAASPLEKAIVWDKGYAVKACSDGDFQKHQDQVDSVLEKLRTLCKKAVDNAISEMESAHNKLKSYNKDSYAFSQHGDSTEFLSVLNKAKSAAQNNTYFGYLDSWDLCKSAKSEQEKTHSAFFQKIKDIHSGKIYKINSNKSDLERASRSFSDGMKGILTLMIIGFFVFGVVSCFNESKHEQDLQRKSISDFNSLQKDLAKRGYKKGSRAPTKEVYNIIQRNRYKVNLISGQIRKYSPNYWRALGLWLSWSLGGAFLSFIVLKILHKSVLVSRAKTKEGPLEQLRRIQRDIEASEQTYKPKLTFIKT
jgi:tetratricopeptide (TPR) repeat protein